MRLSELLALCRRELDARGLPSVPDADIVASHLSGVPRSRLYDLELEKQRAERADMRRAMVGTGDRSERIRTYNFPQGRVTDHRINLTLYKIDQIMDGDLSELTARLAAEHQAELLAALGESG